MKNIKLHICCGTVYLEDYVNIDIQGFLRTEAENASIQFNKTTFDNYYTIPLKKKPLIKRGQFVVDLKLDLLLSWPWNDNSINEIVTIQSMEHFLPDEVEFIISEIYRVLIKGGKFLFDFPDIIETVKQYAQLDFEQMSRLIYCNHKDKYSIHKNAYNKTKFSKLLYNCDRNWSDIIYKEVVEHDYPVIGGIAIK